MRIRAGLAVYERRAIKASNEPLTIRKSPAQWAFLKLSKQMHNYSVGPFARSRKTIFDLIQVVGKSADDGFMWSDFEMTWANDLRKRLKKAGQNVTVTAILLKAIAVAQKIHPESRTEWLPFGQRVTYQTIVAGFTVERNIDGQQTVLLGEIEHPIEKSFDEIAAELKAHAEGPIEKVRPLHMQNVFSFLPYFLRQAILQIGKRFPFLRLTCQKATFGLTSLGKFGVSAHTCPCLCACSFSIGSIEDRLVVRDGAAVVRSMMTVGLNYDERALDGFAAARFMQTVRKLMEGELEEWLPPNSSSQSRDVQTETQGEVPSLVGSGV